MADNIGYTPGSGATVAADDIGGVLYQRVKPAFGPDGVAVDVSTENPLPVLDAEVLSLLKLLIARVQPLSIITGAGSNRLSVDVNNIIGGTVTTVGTVNALTTVGTVNALTTVGTVNTVTNVANVANQTQMGGVTAFGLMHAASRTAFNTGTRTRL